MSLITGANISGANILGKFSALPAEYASLRMDLDFLDTSSITLDGSNNISSILDATSQNRDFSQGTASLRPAFITNVGAQFVDDFLEHTSNLITDSDGTVMFVLRFDRLNADERFISQGNSAVPDGDAFAILKNSNANNNNVRSVYSSGNSPGIGSVLTFTDTSTFRVIVFQRNNIYINTAQQDLVFYGSEPTSRWFDESISGGANRLTIGRNSGSTTNFGRITVKRVSYFNELLNGSDILKLVNGLRSYYSI